MRLNDQESAAMPILPGFGSQPAATTVPHAHPPATRGQTITPARRLASSRDLARGAVDPDGKHRHRHDDHDGERGSTLDVEV
jgi:hypothetical protein